MQNLKLKKTFLIAIYFGFFVFIQNVSAATEVVRTIKPSGQGGDYTTLAAWEAGEQRDLTAADEIAVAQIDGNWSSPDTTAVTINGWTTDATRYIKIYTTAQARHGGKWSGDKYRIAPTTDVTTLNVNEAYTQIIGLQIATTSYTRNYAYAVLLNQYSASSALSYSVIKNVTAGTDTNGVFSHASVSGSLHIYNNIVYDFNTANSIGIYSQAAAGIKNYIYNNTIQNCNTGLYTEYEFTIAQNNLSYNNTNNYAGVYYTGSANNLSGPSQTDAPGTNPRNATVVKFADEVNNDFHLNSTDTGAKNFGADLSADANLAFSDDIDGQARSTSSGQSAAWDIGADEVGGNMRVVFTPDPGQETDFGAATAIYRSVGPGNTTALAVGTSNTLTISGSTATFTSPLPDRVGVGDALQYDSDGNGSIDAIAFIHSRLSSKSYTVKTAGGADPTAVASDNDWSLFRAYTALASAESGNENTGINATVRNFDTWQAAGGKDIATSNEVWNIACYGDAVDTTAVTIGGWTTGANNYIRIYTPVSKEEVGVSQRHLGKWDSTKYILENSSSNGRALLGNVKNIKIFGLQIFNQPSEGYDQNGIELYNSDPGYEIANNIVRYAGSNGTDINGIFISMSTGSGKIYNNLVYDLSAGNGIKTECGGNALRCLVYNNTVYNSSVGFRDSQYQDTIIANNIAQGCANGFYSNWHPDSDYNVSDLTNDAPSTSYRNNLATTVSFFDVANKDFHLLSSDTMAKDHGISNPGSGLFFTDIDGQARIGSWDIGADERPANTVIKGGVRITN